RRVVNAGVAGFGLDQTVLRAEQLVGMYRPEFVIVSFIADDIGRTEWARQVGSKPYFVIDEQGNLEFHLQALPDAARRDLYFPNHGHMTPAGNALVAKEIARVLR